tara:strand:+ start:3228 stop:3662 length:435 start_codon:yes stop_codon:yes gene_type:complete
MPTKVLEISTVQDKEVGIPMYSSSPAAGFPSPGDDNIEGSLNVHDLLVKNPTSTFFVRVSGDSMEGKGIFSGDVLAVDRSLEVKSGRIVVAAVFGEMVVKELKQKDGKCFLYSANSEYAPIEVSGADDCFIWGVVVGSVRQFLV